MDGERFRTLDARERALVAIAVLLDGREAATFLENDAQQGEALQRAALDVAEQNHDVRMPYLGTMLRMALRELS